jgi:transglutaminase-like putative cysteine protease
MNKKTVAVILLSFTAAHASDPFNYHVAVKNFRPSIYTDETSLFRCTSTGEGFTLPPTTCQKIISKRESDGRTTIIIRTGPVSPGPTAAQDAPGRFLADTRFLNLSSSDITGAAARLKKEKDPVSAVERFVYGRITDKTTGIPLLPAAQVCRLGRGDCTEHAVLAVALLRSMGIPARAVVGMYLADEFQGVKNSFVYHMWAESHTGGRWRLVDATRPGEERCNRYIAFAYHNLKTETPLAYLKAVSAIQDLSVEYLGR